MKLIKIEKMSIRPCEKKIVAKRINFNGYAKETALAGPLQKALLRDFCQIDQIERYRRY